MFNSLLVIGMFDDGDLKDIMKLIHPLAFDENYVPGWDLNELVRYSLHDVFMITQLEIRESELLRTSSLYFFISIFRHFNFRK